MILDSFRGEIKARLDFGGDVGSGCHDVRAHAHRHTSVAHKLAKMLRLAERMPIFLV